MIFLILLLALVLRLVHINQSLWLDEAIGAIAVRDYTYSGIVFDFLQADNHPPLYYLALKFWTSMFGYSEIALRSLSVLFGLLTVYLTYLIAKKISENKLFILLATILVTTAPLHIYYSQEVRMYPMITFLASCLVYIFMQVDINPKKVWAWVIFSFFIMLSLASDYVTIFLFPAFFMYSLLTRKQTAWYLNLVLSFIPVILIFVWWLPMFLIQIEGGSIVLAILPSWKDLAGGATLKQAILFWNKFVLGRISLENKTIYYALLIASSIPILISLINALRNNEAPRPASRDVVSSHTSLREEERSIHPRPKNMPWSSASYDKKLLLLWLWFLVPVILGFLGSFFIPVFIYFRFIYVLPAFYLLIARGIMEVKKESLRNLLIGAVLIVNFIGILVYYFDSSQLREDWKGAMVYLENKVNTGEVAIFEFPEPFAPARWYSSGKILMVGVTDRISADPEKTRVRTQNAIADRKGVYYFDYLKDLSDPGGIVQLILDENSFIKTEVYNFRNMGQMSYYVKQ